MITVLFLAKNSRTRIDVIWLWFQCYSHIQMIRHQLWPFWVNLDCRWTSSTSPKQCPCYVVFAQNLAKTSIKTAWHEPNDLPKHHQQPLQYWFDDYPKSFSLLLQCFHRLLTCWGFQDVFSAFLKPVIPQLKCQHFKRPCTFNLIF